MRAVNQKCNWRCGGKRCDYKQERGVSRGVIRNATISYALKGLTIKGLMIKGGMGGMTGGAMRTQRTCNIAHAQTVYGDDVIERVNHENKSERMQVDEALDKRSGFYYHAVAVEEPSERTHLQVN